MKNIGIVSYNIYANFTNYGSALQSWALSQAINKLGKDKWQSKLVDYCPEILKDKDPLNPMKNMWDKDEETRRKCELTLPAIRENYYKFEKFYNERFMKTKNKYMANNFNDIKSDENISRFVCGSDTIFCVDEFGIDDGYYANYDVMKKGYTISYAASFGDSHFNDNSYKLLNARIKNFKALGIREEGMIPYLKEHTNVEVKNVIDPTLLLEKEDYSSIISENKSNEKYILLYARRYNKNMEEFADRLAKENGWKVIEISLQATNAYKHEMRYDAGVEEFLGLIKNAEYVITNSYHGMIFSIQFEKQFVIFSREQCNTKIEELINKFGISDRMLITGNENYNYNMDYNKIKNNISEFKEESWKYLEENLNKMCED